MTDHERCPSLAQAHGLYLEAPVTGPLSDYFMCRWRHTAPAAAASPMVVVPDGCVDLIWADGRLRVAGPDLRPQGETIRQGTTIHGLRFRPGRAASWLGLPMIELVNGRPQLVELWGAAAHRLDEEIADASGDDPGSSFALVVQSRLAGPAAPSARVNVAFDLLAAGAAPGQPVIPRLMSELGMSERTLRRHFDEQFGYGPKSLDRILRFQRFLRLAGAPGAPSIARLAAAAGYADQAHLSRECRRLAGATPVAVVHDLRSRAEINNRQRPSRAREGPR